MDALVIGLVAGVLFGFVGCGIFGGIGGIGAPAEPQVVKETVVVEKEVEVPVYGEPQVVKETVVVEKEFEVEVEVTVEVTRIVTPSSQP